MNEVDQTKLLLSYLEILSNGKIRPDKRSAGGVIRDAKDNIHEIEAAKLKINQLLSLDQSTIDLNKKSENDRYRD